MMTTGPLTPLPTPEIFAPTALPVSAPPPVLAPVVPGPSLAPIPPPWEVAPRLFAPRSISPELLRPNMTYVNAPNYGQPMPSSALTATAPTGAPVGTAPPVSLAGSPPGTPQAPGLVNQNFYIGSGGNPSNQQPTPGVPGVPGAAGAASASAMAGGPPLSAEKLTGTSPNAPPTEAPLAKPPDAEPPAAKTPPQPADAVPPTDPAAEKEPSPEALKLGKNSPENSAPPPAPPVLTQSKLSGWRRQLASNKADDRVEAAKDIYTTLSQNRQLMSDPTSQKAMVALLTNLLKDPDPLVKFYPIMALKVGLVKIPPDQAQKPPFKQLKGQVDKLASEQNPLVKPDKATIAELGEIQDNWQQLTSGEAIA